ncbi:hypothetical protein AAFF_G00113070 [Aldrovandia affinis]|uniref:Uncharacterized protein n=1 Tax=Aldrovandia affinis TaxID=143900 RepID=A0AAD7RTF3_9TELE|nr:hypothetical protein AAFF_G00113070 [Aldrovandia affinis]
MWQPITTRPSCEVGLRARGAYADCRPHHCPRNADGQRERTNEQQARGALEERRSAAASPESAAAAEVRRTTANGERHPVSVPQARSTEQIPERPGSCNLPLPAHASGPGVHFPL